MGFVGLPFSISLTVSSLDTLVEGHGLQSGAREGEEGGPPALHLIRCLHAPSLGLSLSGETEGMRRGVHCQ